MYGYTYLTENLVNGMLYVGQHKAKEFERNKYLGSGDNIKKAIKEFGKKNFSVTLLKECESREKLNKEERHETVARDAVNSPLYYNKVHGGGGTSDWIQTESAKKKMSVNNKNEKHHSYKKKLLEELNLALEKSVNNHSYRGKLLLELKLALDRTELAMVQ